MLFGRPKPNPERERKAIVAFWDWWVHAGARDTAAALDEDDPDSVAFLIAKYLRRIDPGLEFELESKQEGHYGLVVTAAGDPTRRSIARRWLRAAPSDSSWEYGDTLAPADEGWHLTVRGTDIDVAHTVMRVEFTKAALEVSVWHPGYEKLSEAERDRASTYLLEAVLGEEDADTWLERFESMNEMPAEWWPLEELPQFVERLREEHSDDRGQLTWTLSPYQGAQGRRVMAMVRVRLVPATAPALDTHIRVEVPYGDVTPEGFPGPSSLPRLRDLERDLSERVFPDAQCLAVESDDGVRTFHFYADSTSTAELQLRAGTAHWPDGEVKLRLSFDPTWDQVQHLRW